MAGAYVLVLVVVTLANANGHWFGTPATVTVAGTRFEVVRGGGHLDGNALVLESLDPSGAAIVSSRVARFAAAAYPRVEWAMKSAAFSPPALMFLWRTMENPNRTYSKPIEWDGHVGRVLPLRLAETNGWSGTIVGVALAVRGPLTSPLTIDAVTFPGVSSLTSLQEILGQWTRSFPVHGGSIAFPFDKERYDHLSFLLTTVAAQGLAIAACAILARRRRDRVDSRVIWTILIAGWLVLDARWQINLGRQLVQTAEAFAGKTNEEKHLASADAQMFALMESVNRLLPPPPARIFLFSDVFYLRVRSAFFLYPHNVYHGVDRAGNFPGPATLRSGDFVLLFPTARISYDRDKHLLTWPDGGSRGVDERLRSAEGIVLLEMK